MGEETLGPTTYTVVVHHSLPMRHSRSRPPPKAALVSVVANTGCQSCLAGTNLLSKLGLTERYLSKTRLQMSAANGNNLDIIGAIALRLSDSASPSGTETRQIVYICRDTTDFFLSRGACVALGIVPRNFPGVGQTQQPLVDDRGL